MNLYILEHYTNKTTSLYYKLSHLSQTNMLFNLQSKQSFSLVSSIIHRLYFIIGSLYRQALYTHRAVITQYASLLAFCLCSQEPIAARVVQSFSLWL